MVGSAGCPVIVGGIVAVGTSVVGGGGVSVGLEVSVGGLWVSVGGLGVSLGGLGVLVSLLWVEVRVGLLVSVAVAVEVGVEVGLAQTHSGAGVGETETQGFAVSGLGTGQAASEAATDVGSSPSNIRLILMGNSHASVAPAKEATERTLAVFDNRSLLIELTRQDDVNIPKDSTLSTPNKKSAPEGTGSAPALHTTRPL